MWRVLDLLARAEGLALWHGLGKLQLDLLRCVALDSERDSGSDLTGWDRRRSVPVCVPVAVRPGVPVNGGWGSVRNGDARRDA